jgi:hypothetical protein
MNKAIINNKELSDDEKVELYMCISYRLGIIETGDPCIRNSDAERMDIPIKPLSVDQMKLIIMLEEIMNLLIN